MALLERILKRPFDRISEKIRFGGRNVPWPSDEHRERSIIRMIAPIYVRADKALTLAVISRYMSETEGLSTYETGRKLCELIDADFPDAVKH